ncbi:hypothetical protein Xoosp14_187 [Xanthomonas phage Xoo-sp14]|nr:hypothetical protein Xoosp14_187 [Xanthomonas phage Xoo-sp14]
MFVINLFDVLFAFIMSAPLVFWGWVMGRTWSKSKASRSIDTFWTKATLALQHGDKRYRAHALVWNGVFFGLIAWGILVPLLIAMFWSRSWIVLIPSGISLYPILSMSGYLTWCSTRVSTSA